MYCFPVCKGCKEAGTCPKGEVPAFFLQPPTVSGKPYNPAQEKGIQLQCGCWIWPFGTLVRGNRASVSSRFWCETCGRWADPVKEKKKSKDSAETLPLFPDF